MDDSYANGLAALAGGGQAGATLIAATKNRFTTIANTGDSALLPVAAPGLHYYVRNAGTNSMNVFPNTGDAINGAGANTAFALAAGKMALFISMAKGNWDALVSA
jgi:hypothetical protein